MLLNIFITAFLVFMNGFFVAAEFALVKVRASQLELKMRAGSKMARLAKNMTSHLGAYMSATQLGITLASLGLGWIGESVVADIIQSIITFLGITLSSSAIHQIALPAAFVTITVLHIVFGELAPRSVALQKPESISIITALFLRIFYIIFKPFIWSLNSFANLVIRSIGFEPLNAESGYHSSEELLLLLEESSKRGIEGIPDKQLIANVFEFSDIPVKQVMVPRGKIFGIEIKTDPEDIIDSIIDEGYSRLPVYDKSIDNIVGIIFSKDFISLMKHKNLVAIRDIMRPPYFVSENAKIDKILREMQKQKIHLAIVIDDFGGIAGLLTLEDILEEIVGEIQDEYDEEIPFVIKIRDNEYFIQATAAIGDINDSLPIALPEHDDYETLTGLIFHKEGRIPEVNEIIDLGNYFCTIINSSGRNIDKVKLILKENKKLI